jgi:catechol-2,3-dioxygenase
VPAVGRLADLVLDCSDAVALATFWAEVLDRDVEHRDDGWVSLSRGDDGHRMSFQEVEGYQPPQWPGQEVAQQMHLDVLVEDLKAADARVRALKATPLSDVLDPGPKQWRIYCDPAGHPFCLVTSAS